MTLRYGLSEMARRNLLLVEQDAESFLLMLEELMITGGVFFGIAPTVGAM